MSFAVHYMDEADGCVHEHLLTFYLAEGLDAASLASYIKLLVSSYDFDVNKMVSQGYDEASVMSGCYAGVQTRVRSFAPYAVYIHCYSHILKLVLVDSVKSVPAASEFFVLLEALYVYVSSSKVMFCSWRNKNKFIFINSPLNYKSFLILAGCVVMLLLMLFVINMTLLYLL